MCHFGGREQTPAPVSLKSVSFFCTILARIRNSNPAQPEKPAFYPLANQPICRPNLKRRPFLIFPALKIKNPAFITGPGVLLDKKRLTVQKITQ